MPSISTKVSLTRWQLLARKSVGSGAMRFFVVLAFAGFTSSTHAIGTQFDDTPQLENAPTHNAPNPPVEPLCSETRVLPAIATDGQRVFLDASVAQAEMQVLFTGYRYNDAPPTNSHRLGEGREQIYCGCQRVELQITGGGETESVRPYITVPTDAPTGDYSLELLPASVSCSSGGIRATCGESASCVNPSLHVMPSYIVTTMERLDVNFNSEDDSNNPAEMQFLFTSGSGTAFGAGEHLVEWSGSFPGGTKGTSHITNADHTAIDARLPLFVGEESLMNVIECREECVGQDDSLEGGCIAQCESDQAAGRYNNRLNIGFSGLEYDTSPSKAYGVVVGALATAGSCVVAAELGQPCTTLTGGGSAVTIGIGAGMAVNKLLENESDDLGTVLISSRQTDDWNVDSTFGPIALSGKGDLAIHYRNHRVAAPRILDYTVRLKSIKITGDYESGDCKSPNEVFVNARADLHQGQFGLPDTTRFPGNDAVVSMEEGDTWEFGANDGIIATRSFSPEKAPQSPFIYVEVGVWERDNEGTQKDLIGVVANTHFLGEEISRFTEARDAVTPEGFFIRRGTFSNKKTVHGYAGSDNHCFSSIFAHGWDPQAEQGSAVVTYEVDVTWLKAPSIN